LELDLDDEVDDFVKGVMGGASKKQAAEDVPMTHEPMIK
jgi:hypothetical protein